MRAKERKRKQRLSEAERKWKERRKSLQTLGLLFDQMGIAKVSLGAHRPIDPSAHRAELHVQLVRIRLPLKDVPQDLGTSTKGHAMGCHGVPDICDACQQ